MATSSRQVSVATTATRLDQAPASAYSAGGSVAVKNRGSAAVWLGGSDVTTSIGYQLDAGEAVSLDLFQGGSLYGIVASGTQTVHVLQAGAV